MSANYGSQPEDKYEILIQRRNSLNERLIALRAVEAERAVKRMATEEYLRGRGIDTSKPKEELERIRRELDEIAVRTSQELDKLEADMDNLGNPKPKDPVQKAIHAYVESVIESTPLVPPSDPDIDIG